VPKSQNTYYTNKHGLETTKYKARLARVRADITDYTPKELARVLVTIAYDLSKEATIITAQGLEIKEALKLTDKQRKQP